MTHSYLDLRHGSTGEDEWDIAVLAWREFIIADTVQAVLQKHQINTHHLMEHMCER